MAAERTHHLRRFFAVGAPKPALLVPFGLLAVGLSACAPKADDSAGGELPQEETIDSSGSSGGLDSFEIDTSIEDSGFDGTPAHTLSLQHDGQWFMTPNGGPWTAMTGLLHVVETLDGDDTTPACDVTFALTGEAAEEACSSCDAAFDVFYYVSEGDRSACLDPELPDDRSTVSMGWDNRRQKVMMNYDGTGVWLDWYDGERADDTVSFAWTGVVGVAVDTGS